jgi:hypothetical protein
MIHVMLMLILVLTGLIFVVVVVTMEHSVHEAGEASFAVLWF